MSSSADMCSSLFSFLFLRIKTNNFCEETLCHFVMQKFIMNLCIHVYNDHERYILMGEINKFLVHHCIGIVKLLSENIWDLTFHWHYLTLTWPWLRVWAQPIYFLFYFLFLCLNFTMIWTRNRHSSLVQIML